jgi:hypothetical protein
MCGCWLACTPDTHPLRGTLSRLPSVASALASARFAAQSFLSELPQTSRSAYLGRFHAASSLASAGIQFLGLKPLFRRLPLSTILFMQPLTVRAAPLAVRHRACASSPPPHHASPPPHDLPSQSAPPSDA